MKFTDVLTKGLICTTVLLAVACARNDDGLTAAKQAPGKTKPVVTKKAFTEEQISAFANRAGISTTNTMLGTLEHELLKTLDLKEGVSCSASEVEVKDRKELVEPDLEGFSLEELLKIAQNMTATANKDMEKDLSESFLIRGKEVRSKRYLSLMAIECLQEGSEEPLLTSDLTIETLSEEVHLANELKAQIKEKLADSESMEDIQKLTDSLKIKNLVQILKVDNIIVENTEVHGKIDGLENESIGKLAQSALDQQDTKVLNEIVISDLTKAQLATLNVNRVGIDKIEKVVKEKSEADKTITSNKLDSSAKATVLPKKLTLDKERTEQKNEIKNEAISKVDNASTIKVEQLTEEQKKERTSMVTNSIKENSNATAEIETDDEEATKTAITGSKAIQREGVYTKEKLTD